LVEWKEAGTDLGKRERSGIAIRFVFGSSGGRSFTKERVGFLRKVWIVFAVYELTSSRVVRWAMAMNGF